jgi:uncharacterized protein YbjT (DUF2867 family)
METKKIIAVVGATGSQGGGLVRAILNDKNSEFTVRAITRDPQSEAAKELEALGAEVVQADIDDADSMRKAFEGAYGAYLVTFFWHHMSPEQEMAEARILAEAARDAGLRHVIWSTLEDTRKFIPLHDDRMPTLKEKYKVPHFDAKGESNKFFEELNLPVTYLHTSFYWDNYINFGMAPKKGPDGELAITFPMGDKKLPSMAAEDIGKCAYGIFKKGQELIGKDVGIAGQHISGAEMADTFSRVLGKKVVYNEVTPEVFRSFGFPGADDLGNMFQFNRDFADEFSSKRDIEFSRSLNPELQDFNTWVTRNKDRIPIEE